MKILFVDLQYEYGMRNRGPNEIGQRGFRDVFIQLGHEVETFYYDELLNNLNQLQIELIRKVSASSYDLVYFILFGDQFKVETLDTIAKKTRTINWFGDDHWRFESFTRKYAPHFTYSITTDQFAVPKYKAIGVKNVIESQWAALDEPLVGATSDYKYDVSFVGGSHSVRRWFVHELEKKGINVSTFGYGWPSGPVSLEQMRSIFRTSKINLNLSNSVNFDLRYLTHSWKNPIVAMRSLKTISQIKARNFEIPYYGGFQLTDYVPTLENYLNIGEEVVCYRDPDEAALQIKYYLESENLRERIKEQSVQRARSEHSYLFRQKKILESIL